MILGLVVGALAGATADEEFDCFISPNPIPFALPLGLPYRPHFIPGRWPEVGVLAGASAAAGASLAGDIGLVRGGSSTNRPTAAAEGEGERKTGGMRR